MIEIKFHIKVKAARFCGYEIGDGGIWEYSGSFSEKGPMTYEDANKKSNEFMDQLIQSYQPEEVLERHSHMECLIRSWNRAHDTTSDLVRFIVDTVYPEISDNMKIKYSFIRFYNSAMIKLRDHNLLVPCSRCGGLGHYSKDRYGDTTCYKCKGFKFQLPRDSKKFRKSLEVSFDNTPENSYN